MTDVLHLTSDDVDGLMTPEEYVTAVREAYRQRGDGAPAKPRTKLTPGDESGMLTSYLAMLPETGAMGGYIYTAGFDAADAWFITALFDAASGRLRALIDGASMNPFKTGATGAIAVDELAREDAADIALIGTGPQASGQLVATSTVRDLESVRVFSPTQNHRREFAATFDETLQADVVAVEDAAAAVSDADIVITATTASEPVINGDLVEPGTHVTAMGQYHPEKRELDDTTIERATYVPDLRERAFQDAGSFLHALEHGVVDESHVHAELGEIVAGNVEGRTATDEITVFDSGGTGIETVGAAQLLYERALEADRGTTIEFAPASEALTGR